MANEQWLKVPYFARGKAESLEKSLTTGRFKDGLDKALFYFATDAKQWILVDVDKSIHKITSYDEQPTPVGEGKVKRVDYLPSLIDGDVNTLYIMGNVVYSFDGAVYHPTYEEAIGVLPEGMNVVEYVDAVASDTVDSANQYTDDAMALNIVQGG